MGRRTPGRRPGHDERRLGHDGAVRVLVADEHELTAVGLQLALSTPGWVVECTNGPTAADVVRHAGRFEPWCVLLGIPAGGDTAVGTQLVTDLVRSGAEVVLLTTERRRAFLAEYLEAGAAGWVPRSASLEVLRTTISQFQDGIGVIGRNDRSALVELLRREREEMRRARSVVDRLTEREACVLVALADGLNAEQIAAEHFVSVATVRSQIRSVLQKLDVRSQLAAASIAGAYRELLPDRDASPRDRRRLLSSLPDDGARTGSADTPHSGGSIEIS